MDLNHRPVGVCSWSLRAADTAQLIAGLQSLGLSHTQLALGPLLDMTDADRRVAIDQLRSAGITLTAGMISFAGEDYSSIAAIRRTGGLVPDEFWPERRDRVLAAAALAESLGVSLLSLHYGFLPHRGAANYDTVLGRGVELATALAKRNLTAVMETGQDDGANALNFIRDTAAANVGVNFDPGNMILYGSDDPIAALRTLGPHVKHIHLKDAIPGHRPRETWGNEVAFGAGSLDHAAFFRTLDEIGYEGPYVIECECEHTHEASLRTVGVGLTSLSLLGG